MHSDFWPNDGLSLTTWLEYRLRHSDREPPLARITHAAYHFRNGGQQGENYWIDIHIHLPTRVTKLAFEGQHWARNNQNRLPDYLLCISGTTC